MAGSIHSTSDSLEKVHQNDFAASRVSCQGDCFGCAPVFDPELVASASGTNSASTNPAPFDLPLSNDSQASAASEARYRGHRKAFSADRTHSDGLRASRVRAQTAVQRLSAEVESFVPSYNTANPVSNHVSLEQCRTPYQDPEFFSTLPMHSPCKVQSHSLSNLYYLKCPYPKTSFTSFGRSRSKTWHMAQQSNQGDVNGNPSHPAYDAYAASNTSMTSTPGPQQNQVNPYAQDGSAVGGASYYQNSANYTQPVCVVFALRLQES